MTQVASLVDYAAFILADPRVGEIMASINISNKIATRFDYKPDSRVKEEASPYVEFYREAIKAAKRQSLLNIIEENFPLRWQSNAMNINDVLKGENPSYRDLGLVIFWYMLIDRDFQPYFIEGRLPWLAAPLPTERRDQFVVAFFLWLKMDVRLDKQRNISYYVKAIQDGGGNKNDISTVKARKEFIDRFGGFLHTEVWTALDYVSKNKTGTIIRLRLTSSQTGLVVVQECGELVGKCNRQYMVTDDSISEIARLYLDKATRPLQCSLCSALDAEFFHPEDTSKFYCASCAELV